MIPTKRRNKKFARSYRKYKQNTIACQLPETQKIYYGKELLKHLTFKEKCGIIREV